MSLELEEHLVARANVAMIPLTANFELTPVCNLNCDMCFIRMSRKGCELHGGLRSVEEWLDIARQFQQLGTLFILLTGCEPMLYSGFKELYLALRKMGFILTLNTNGTLIDESICQMFASAKPRRVNVTLYGGNDTTYQRLCHHPGGFDKCVRALRLLRQYDIDTKLNVSVVKKNLDDYEEIMAIAKELDIPVVVNSYMFPALRSLCHGCRDVDTERIDPLTAAEIQEQYVRYKKESEGEDYHRHARQSTFSIEHLTPNPEGIGLDCRAGRSSVWINWQHTMTPCVLMEHPAVSLQQTTVKQAWNEIIQKGQQLPKHEECCNCKLRKLCQVCYAAASHEKKVRGNLYYLCDMAHHEYYILQQEAAKE